MVDEHLLPWLRDRFHIKVAGVLHVGANAGQEAALYSANGLKVAWVEGDPQVFPKLEDVAARHPNQRAYLCLASDSSREVPFYRASNDGGSSSVLQPDAGALKRSGVSVLKRETICAQRLDEYFGARPDSLLGINMVNVDVQGYELPVLRGLTAVLDRFDVVVAELNFGPLYLGATRPSQLDEFLASRGFARVFLSVGYPQGEGIWARTPTSSVERRVSSTILSMVERAAGWPLVARLQRSVAREALRRMYYLLRRRRVP